MTIFAFPKAYNEFKNRGQEINGKAKIIILNT